MIKSLTIKGFKSLEKITLNLSNLNLFVGTNASGKSNFFDGLRVLQGIGYGFTIDEIFNGKPKSATSEVWDAIRGGSSKDRRQKFEILENEAAEKGAKLLCCAACQEVEAWLLAGHLNKLEKSWS